MSGWVSAASVLGALGLFVAGQLWLVAGLRVVLPRALARAERGAGRGRSYALGLGTALVAPSNAWSSQTMLAAVHRPGRSLEAALWQLLGASLALACSAWIAVGVEAGAAFMEPAAWTLLAAGGLLAPALPRLRAPLLLALGAGACLLGTLHLATAFEGLAGNRLDAWGLAMPVRCLVAVLLGAGAAAALRSPAAVLVPTLFAAEHATLHLTTGISLFVGASLGGLVATLPAWRPDGTAQGRRAALGLSTMTGIGAVLTLFILTLGLPLLGDMPAPLDQPLWLLATWISVALVGASLVAVPLLVPGTRLLENRLGNLGSDTTRSQILDPTTLAVPSQAFDALRMEIDAMRAMTASLARRVLGEERVSDFRTKRDIESIAQRAGTVSRFTDELLAGEVSSQFLRAAERIPSVAAVYMHVCRQMDTLRRPELQPASIPDQPLRARILQYRWGFLHFLEQGCVAEADPLAREQELQQLEVHRGDLERRILTGCWQHTLDPNLAHGTLEALEILRASAQALFFALGDAHVQTRIETAPAPPTEAEAEAEGPAVEDTVDPSVDPGLQAAQAVQTGDAGTGLAPQEAAGWDGANAPSPPPALPSHAGNGNGVPVDGEPQRARALFARDRHR